MRRSLSAVASSASSRVAGLCGRSGDASATVFAPATGAGGALSVVRVSGPRAVHAAGLLASGRAEGSAAAAERANLRARPRALRLRWLSDPATGARLDRALVAYFPRSSSATGEDVVEFHLHGGPAVITGVLSALGRADGLRPAAPGEFTRRALRHGKVRDLAEAEALADLTRAETHAQVQLALARLGDGRGAGPMYVAWRERAVRAQAHAEALIDFGEDVEFAMNGTRGQRQGQRLPPSASAEALAEQVRAIAGEVSEHLARDAKASELVRYGVRAALVGLPNSGKSSMANALVGRPVSIVSPLHGTTRDVVEAQMSVAGGHVILSDTAGISGAPGDDIEAEGERRAQLAAANAHVVLHVIDLHAITTLADGDSAPWEAHLRGALSSGRALAPDALDVVVVLNKADLVRDDGVQRSAVAVAREGGSACLASCVSPGGLDALREELSRATSAILGATAPADLHAVVANERHRAHLQRARDALLRACSPDHHSLLRAEIAAEELRAASSELDALLGQGSGAEAVLDAVFSEFCIGK